MPELAMPELAMERWILGALSAYIVGVAKTGVPGLGILAVPLMVLAVDDARLSAGWLLPVLCVADIFALAYWRKHAEAGRLFSLAPWVFVGIGAGALALGLSERILRVMVGCVVLVMLCIFLWRRSRDASKQTPSHGPTYGIAAGFATTVANAAGPIMNLYLLSKRLPKEEFLATGAWFFFIVNLSKIPIYLWHGLISVRSLTFDACMIPAVLAGALSGRFVAHRISPRLFEAIAIVLTAISTVMLFR